MPMSLCIHGHFYQPPREDPWLGEVLPEGSAAPGLNWNERICRESYAPLGFARLLDEAGAVRGIVNAYEWISFNFGPTLLSWMQRRAPEVYARVLEGDRASRERLGFGNAMAQVRHHVIMPLATGREKRLETIWALQDFEARYGRAADGIWLAETAVDTATLEVLAEAGLAYTVLAPRQAQAVAGPDGAWRNVDEGSLDTRRPYLVELPSGRSLAVFFYDGGLSQAVAFERLLDDGGAFWARVRSALGEGLLSLATDGETYGHHFKFGEMALAYVLDQARRDPDLALTNYAAHLAADPPQWRVRVHENSSWSCVHGVERWRADCGCCTEGRPGWNQAWRAPLRTALRTVKDALDAHWDEAAPALFRDPEAALTAYGAVLAGTPREEFEAREFKPGLDETARDTARALLEMQRLGQASFASCAWFFDDLDRIEPLNAMANALRAMDLAVETGAPPLQERFARDLAGARSNATRRNPGGLAGDELFRAQVLARRETRASLTAQALLMVWARNRGKLQSDPASVAWPGVSVDLEFGPPDEGHTATGKAVIRDAAHPAGAQTDFQWKPASGTSVLGGKFRCDGDGDWLDAEDLAWGKRQAVALAWAEAAEAEAWERDLLAMQTGADLFLDRAQAQEDQNQAERWARFGPALAWMWISGQAHGELLEAFLRRHAAAHGACAGLAARVAARALDILAAPTPDWDALEAMIARARDLCPDLDWWAVQNRAWTLLPQDPEAGRAARLLGFSSEALDQI
ncbi:DUF3536 domain-containing protein [Desulfocurvus sp. DL9XJH121]